VGMDDIELSRYLPTPLSTISHSLKKLADEAANILLERIASKERRNHKTAKLPMTFIERGSTGPAPPR
jgi:DNA-binding LacI/PurR family transcriptional regulator